MNSFYKPIAIVITAFIVSSVTGSTLFEEDDQIQPRLFLEILSTENKTFYAEFLTEVTWREAVQFCADKRMTLADFSRIGEEYAVIQSLLDVGVRNDTYHIGATNLDAGDSNDEFYWINNGEFAFSMESSTVLSGQLHIATSTGYYIAGERMAKFICQEDLSIDC